MKHVRFLSVLTLLAMLSGTVACSADTPDSPEDTTAPVETTTDTTAAPETKEYEAPGVTYDSATVTAASYQYDDPWDILKYDIALHEENGDVINDAIVKRNRQVEEELDVVIALYPLLKSDRGSSQKLRNLILTMDDTLSFMLPMNACIAPMLTADNMVVDLNSVKTLDLTKSWWNQNANAEYTIGGKQLAAVGELCFFNLGAPIVTFFQKEMVTDNKLEDPYQLVAEGKWTQDKVIELSTAVARDLNGDGAIQDADQFGMSAETSSLGYWMMAAGIRLSERDKDGNIVIALNTQRTVDTVEKLVPFFNTRSIARLQGLCDDTYGSYHSEYFIPKMDAGEMLFMSGQLLMALNMRANESDFGIVPTPKFDEEQEEYISFANTWFSDHLLIPQTCKNLDRTGHVIDAMGYYSQQYVTPEFIERSVKTKAVRDGSAAEMVDLILETQTFDVAYIFDWGKIRTTVENFIQNNNANFASEYAKIESAVKTALAETLAQMNVN